MAAPETEPGRQLIYHYLSYGWLCGGIIEHVSGKKFQDILEESIVRPLNVEGELYIGIPPGVESRLATLAIDADDPSRLAPKAHPGIPSSLTLTSISNLIALLNILDGRRAIVPGGNGHFSARALARYYATLVDGGVIPPQNQNQNKEDTTDEVETTIFVNPKAKIHDAFLGTGDYKNLTLPNGVFGLGFSRCRTAGGSLFGFGHAGLGGSTAYCDINNRFAIAVTLNKLSEGALTGEIIRFICSQLDLPVPLEYVGST
ncbi:putative beta-lactamase/transpeptidase [Helianthus annuus]|nr:putative beta-lactamase/transpeptidase [Helianthus annuus]KAJ0944779.1 putative beta-lactamase/transpeptidase [Helianthus annuus]